MNPCIILKRNNGKMKDIDFYRDDINEELKGVITIDNEDYAAELKIKKVSN